MLRAKSTELSVKSSVLLALRPAPDLNKYINTQNENKNIFIIYLDSFFSVGPHRPDRYKISF